MKCRLGRNLNNVQSRIFILEKLNDDKIEISLALKKSSK
jgi:hypothetical protein